MKSVHLTNAYHPTSGGVRAVYRSLLESGNRLGRPVRLVVPGPSYAVEDVGLYGRIYTVKAPGALAFDPRYRVIMPQSYLFRWREGVAAILRHEQPDIVEICDKLSLFYIAGLLRKRLMRGVRRPVLIGVSAERFDDSVRAFISRRAAAQFFARWYMRNVYAPVFDYHVANSEYTAAELRASLAPHRQRVVHVCAPGVESDAFTVRRADSQYRGSFLRQIGGDGQSVLLFYAGRLSPEKNTQLLVDTLATLLLRERAGAHNYRLVVVGDGPTLDELKRSAGERAPGRTTFVGAVRDRSALRDLLGLADIVLHSNPREPFGIAPLEAMAAGIPVVLPSSGGVLSYATPETTWLAAPEPWAFANAVEGIVRAPQKAARMADAARKRAREFHSPDATDRLFRLYDDLHEDYQEMYGRGRVRSRDVDDGRWTPRGRRIADDRSGL